MIEPGDSLSGKARRASAGDVSHQRPRVAFVVRLTAVVVVGSLLGVLVTYLAIQPVTGFGVVAVGPWTFRPKIGTAEIDPYARAMLARTGELPLGVAEGSSFLAQSDSSGMRFDPGCDYRVTGTIPRARYWTLSLNSGEGDLVANPADRYGFTSAEILRSASGDFEIIVSRYARAGNWLPIGRTAGFVLVLRLYDTAIDTRSAVPDAAEMPRIEKKHCR